MGKFSVPSSHWETMEDYINLCEITGLYTNSTGKRKYPIPSLVARIIIDQSNL